MYRKQLKYTVYRILFFHTPLFLGKFSVILQNEIQP